MATLSLAGMDGPRTLEWHHLFSTVEQNVHSSQLKIDEILSPTKKRNTTAHSLGAGHDAGRAAEGRVNAQLARESCDTRLVDGRIFQGLLCQPFNGADLLLLPHNAQPESAMAYHTFDSTTHSISQLTLVHSTITSALPTPPPSVKT